MESGHYRSGSFPQQASRAFSQCFAALTLLCDSTQTQHIRYANTLEKPTLGREVIGADQHYLKGMAAGSADLVWGAQKQEQIGFFFSIGTFGGFGKLKPPFLSIALGPQEVVQRYWT